MTWDDFRFVLALSRAGTLAGAARAMGVDRTTAGRRLAALEERLGVQLVQRAPGGGRLTEVARAIADHAGEMEAAALSIERDLATREARVAGMVRVSATEALGSTLLAGPLAALPARHTGLRVELVTELRAVSLARGEADVAVRLFRPTEPTTAGRRIGAIAYAPYAARRAARGTRKAAPALLLYDDPVAGEETEWLRRRYPQAPVHLRSNSTAVLAGAAAEAAGIAVLPRFVGDAHPGLERLEEGDDIPRSDLWVLVHRDQRRAARIAAVRTCVETALLEARPRLTGSRASGR